MIERLVMDGIVLVLSRGVETIKEDLRMKQDELEFPSCPWLRTTIYDLYGESFSMCKEVWGKHELQLKDFIRQMGTIGKLILGAMAHLRGSQSHIFQLSSLDNAQFISREESGQGRT